MGNSKGTNTLRFTDEEFKELLYNTYNGKVISLDRYITAKEKIRFKDLEYNEIWFAYPYRVLHGQRCPSFGIKSSSDAKRLDKDFVKYDIENNISTILDLKLKVLEENFYKNNLEKIDLIDEFGFKYSTTYSNLLKAKKSGKKTLRRYAKSNPYSLENLNHLLIINNSDYIVDMKLTNGISNNTSLICLNDYKGNTIEKRLCDILKNVRNMKPVAIREIRNTKQYRDKVYHDTNGEYSFIGNFKNIKTKSSFKHNLCGTTFDERPDNFERCTNRCPKCCDNNISLGERTVENILCKYNVNFIHQYSFNDCVYKQRLKFDFAIFKNNELFCLLEYQGQQHYKPVNFGDSKISDNELLVLFNDGIKRDNIKRDYCRKNNITLIEIPYWDFNNIENILIKNNVI